MFIAGKVFETAEEAAAFAKEQSDPTRWFLLVFDPPKDPPKIFGISKLEVAELLVLKPKNG